MMDQFKTKLETWALNLARQELKRDREYCLWTEKQDELWERFREEQPKEVVRAHMAMADLEADMEDRKGFRLFWIGVRLGLSAALNAASPED